MIKTLLKWRAEEFSPLFGASPLFCCNLPLAELNSDLSFSPLRRLQTSWTTSTVSCCCIRTRFWEMPVSTKRLSTTLTSTRSRSVTSWRCRRPEVGPSRQHSSLKLYNRTTNTPTTFLDFSCVNRQRQSDAWSPDPLTLTTVVSL